MTINFIERTPLSLTERVRVILAVAALGLIVFGAKLLFVRHFGSPVPYWDQWDAEADLLYRNYLSSNLSWSMLFSAHNEHRIFLTRMLSLVLFEIDGGWDPILQMMVNAVLHVLAIVLIVLTLNRILRPNQLVALVAFAAMLFVLPIGWENLLAGFQSQFYLLLIFSILSLTGFAGAPAFSVRWWISVAGAVAAFFSMASGSLVGVAAVSIILLQLLLRVRQGGREYLGVATLAAMTLVMIAYVPHIAGHDDLKAHGIRELLTALLISLYYPQSKSFTGILMNLPLVGYACFVLATRSARTSPHWGILCIVIWWFGQVLLLSYGRAVAPTSSRYLDVTIFAMPINFAILLFAAQVVTPSLQRALFAATTVWLAVLLCGLAIAASRSAIPSVFEKAAQSREQETNVAAYLQTGNLAVLQNKALLAIPYPDSERLAALLSDPAIRMTLPSELRPADIDQQFLFERTLLRGRFRGLVERGKLTLMSLAPILFGLGLALALAAGLYGRCLTTTPQATR